MEGGLHAFCCPKTLGSRTRWIHNPLVEEFVRIMTSAGHYVIAEQQDPSMGPHARLDLVEYPSEVGTAAAYDVTAVTALTSSAPFIASCALTPGHAASLRFKHKLDQQYQGRVPGSRLIPLVVELGGRCHP